jgi:hypothetical protein
VHHRAINHSLAIGLLLRRMLRRRGDPEELWKRFRYYISVGQHTGGLTADHSDECAVSVCDFRCPLPNLSTENVF